MRKPVSAVVAAALLLATAGCGVFGGSDKASGDIQVYSARHYDLEEAFAEFEKDTGLTVDFLFAEDAELLKRIEAEGRSSPADLYMTVDAGNLWAAKDAGVLHPLKSQVLERAVPRGYRDAESTWFGLALRARTVAYNPDNVDVAEFDTENTYAGLADPRWKGRLCMRDSTEAYTQSLVAALIESYGKEATKAMVQGWLDNDVDIMSNDILLLEAVAAGTCDVAIVNHYYLARELAKDPEMNVRLFWASQEGRGVQVNLSGAGVVRTSDSKSDAQRLLEWIATEGQRAFVGDNHEFPVNPAVEPGSIVAEFGDYKPMPVDAEAYGRRNAEALDLLAEVGYE